MPFRKQKYNARIEIIHVRLEVMTWWDKQRTGNRKFSFLVTVGNFTRYQVKQSAMNTYLYFIGWARA